MIKPDAKLSIQRISLSNIIITEFQQRYPSKLNLYIQLLQEHPGEYAGFVSVQPSKIYEGLYELLDGHHRYVASIMTGRKDVLAVVIEE